MTTHCEKCKTWMHAHDTYALVYSYVCMSARKKAPVNLLMCPFELCMFIAVSMQLQVVFKYDFLVLIPYCWSVALEKKKKKENHGERENRTAVAHRSRSPYSSPTVTLKLHCEQFWTFIPFHFTLNRDCTSHIVGMVKGRKWC